MQSPSTRVPLTARRNGPLAGRLRVPGDKSISIRALILGALTVGETRVCGLLEGGDVLNTAKALAALGARIEKIGNGAWSIRGVGVGGFAEPADGSRLGRLQAVRLRRLSMAMPRCAVGRCNGCSIPWSVWAPGRWFQPTGACH